MKLFIHVGYAKCGSTSLQEALAAGSGVLFPKAGRNGLGVEHLSLPLHLKGIDDWTRQFISDEWVATQHAAMLKEVAEANRTVVISSERLASLSDSQIEQLAETFGEVEIEIVIVTRSRDKYLDSTWRHAVFHHDYAVRYADFLVKMQHFSFGAVVPRFERFFKVHQFDMDSSEYPENFSQLTGATFEFGRANVGVPKAFAELLQSQHELLGSNLFKEVYTKPVKERMLSVITAGGKPEIDLFTVPLF